MTTATAAPDAVTSSTEPVDDTTVDQLFRDAVAIRLLLDDLDADDHRIRSDLLLARDEIRARAAILWAARGHRPITEHR